MGHVALKMKCSVLHLGGFLSPLPILHPFFASLLFCLLVSDGRQEGFEYCLTPSKRNPEKPRFKQMSPGLVQLLKQATKVPSPFYVSAPPAFVAFLLTCKVAAAPLRFGGQFSITVL